MRRAWIAIAIACGGCGADRASCLAAGATIGHVGRCDLGATSLRYAVLSQPSGDQGKRRAVRWLVDRELLAQAALEAGELLPTVREVRSQIEKGEAYLRGARLQAAPWLDEQGLFDYQALERYLGSAGMTDDAFVAEQRREELAASMTRRITPDHADAWLAEHCRAAEAAGAITIDPALFAGFDPCS